MSAPPLEAFAAATTSAFAAEARAAPGLLQDLYRRARAAYPGVEVEEGAFLAYVAARLPEARSLADALAALRTDELYLACGCVAGDPAAMAAFERSFGEVLLQTLSRFSLSAADREDLKQSLRIAMFMKKNLARYSGRGELRGWLRTAASRCAIDLLRTRQHRPDSNDEIVDSLPMTGDLELDLARRRFNAEFRAALGATIAALSLEDRGLLAQHYVDRLTIDQLSVVLGLHRATVARRLVKLREQLVASTKLRIQAKLQLDEQSLESMMRLADSRLEVSVFRMLRS